MHIGSIACIMNSAQWKQERVMENNYWISLAQDESAELEDVFLRIRELYTSLLKHLYDNPRDIPDFRIHFSLEQKSEEEGLESGYRIATITRKNRDITEHFVHDVTEIENFENSYTWYQDNIFVIFDYCGGGISPLQFVTRSFFEEVYKQIYFYGIRRVSISHMYDLIISGGILEFFHGLYRLDINFLQNLSAETYERKYADSRIIIPRIGSRTNRRTLKQGLKVAFSEPIAFAPENHRQIRKLLELSNDALALVVDETGKIRGLSDKHAFPNECEVKIKGHLSWRIAYDAGQKISYHNARYHINVSRKADLDVSDLMKSVDPTLSPVEVSRIANVIVDAASQKYGTILIIGKTDDIQSECERLTQAKVGIGISPISLDHHKDMLPSFVSIDGAVLMDTRCSCVCIGAILDGDAAKGTIARGARFNSSLNYIRRRKELGQNFVAIVISEDGTTDAVAGEKVTRLNI